MFRNLYTPLFLNCWFALIALQDALVSINQFAYPLKNELPGIN